MTWFRCGGGGSGIPAALKNRMNAVLNKKFGTAVDYPAEGWPDDVNLLGELEEKTAAAASICTFDDGADDVPTKSLVVTIPPTLSGVSSVTETQTGKNLLDMTVYDGGSYNPAVGTAITLSLSASQFTKTSNAYSIDTTTSWKTFSVRMPVKSGATYYRKFTMSASGTNLGSSEYYLDADNKVIGSVSNNTDNPHTKTGTLSIPSGAVWFVITFTNRSTATNTLTITEPQIEVGSTAHAYEPYTTPTQYTASLGRTIYGGQADIVNGTGKDNRLKYELDETDTWGAYGGTTHSFWHNVATGEDRPIKQTEVTTSICNELAYSSNTPATAPDFSFCIQGGQRIVVTADSTIDTVDKFKTWLSSHNLVFVCPATTPTDFTFDGQEIPTRLGVNNFWSDSGDTEVTYRGQGTLTPITPTLITKTITANGSYQAADDQADGYSEVVVNVSGGSCERLFYARCYDNYQVEIPTISSLVQGTNYSSYVSYDTTTKKFTALQDFTAVIIGWVYTYQTYEASYSQGAFVVNNKRLSTYTATGKSQGSTGGAYMVYNLKQGDTFYPYTPSTDGYPRQNCKVYLVSDLNDDIYTFADENA